MKLRFDKNSLRLRLRKSDLEKLREKNMVSECIRFPEGSLEYRLVISSVAEEVTARMHLQSIEVAVPDDVAVYWMNSDETGIYQTISWTDKHLLDIVIEKDFPCKDRPEENASDSFTELAEKRSKEC